jgi:hypothetical protein
MSKNETVLVVLMVASSCVGQTLQPKVLDLLTEAEFRSAGLNKLTPQELESLNAGLLRIMVTLGRADTTKLRTANPVSSDSEFFDSRGTAVAYFDDDGTAYLWSGEPAAYRDEDSLFGFNGIHLGWLHDDGIYDHEGNLVAAVAERFKGPVQPAPFKSLKGLKPFKAFRELKPLKPLFVLTWSTIGARHFFLKGIE